MDRGVDVPGMAPEGGSGRDPRPVRAPRAHPSPASTLAGSGAVFCDPTTLSNSQLIDTVEACQDEYDKRAGLVRVPMEMVPVDECQHPEGYTLCPVCGPVTPGDFPPTPAAPRCERCGGTGELGNPHLVAMNCPACAPAPAKETL